MWADWLCGEHKPKHRKTTPATFADPVGERVDGDYKLGMFLGNSRRRARKLTPDRRAELDAPGMRW